MTFLVEKSRLLRSSNSVSVPPPPLSLFIYMCVCACVRVHVFGFKIWTNWCDFRNSKLFDLHMPFWGHPNLVVTWWAYGLPRYEWNFARNHERMQDVEFCNVCFVRFNFFSVAIVDQMPAIFEFVYLSVIICSDVAKEYFNSTWCVNLKRPPFHEIWFF
jgi:hypothetical protein